MDSISTVTPVSSLYSSASFFNCLSTSILPFTRRRVLPSDLPSVFALSFSEEPPSEEPPQAASENAIVPVSKSAKSFFIILPFLSLLSRPRRCFLVFIIRKNHFSSYKLSDMHNKKFLTCLALLLLRIFKLLRRHRILLFKCLYKVRNIIIAHTTSHIPDF